MSLFRLKVLETFEGTDSATKLSCQYAWVIEAKPRKYKLKLAKASATDLNVIRQNVGGVVLMNVGVMEASGEPMLYYKEGDEIEVHTSPEELSEREAMSKTYTQAEIKRLCDDAARIAVEAYQLDQMLINDEKGREAKADKSAIDFKALTGKTDKPELKTATA
jgi:hypothetical protein